MLQSQLLSFRASLKTSMKLSDLLLFLNTALDIIITFHFHLNFVITLSTYTGENAIGTLIGISQNL